MTKSTVRRKGHVTIPKEIRVNATIHEGTQIDFQIQCDGTILMIPIHKSISLLKGIIKSKRNKRVSLKDMEKAISDGVQERMNWN